MTKVKKALTNKSKQSSKKQNKKQREPEILNYKSKNINNQDWICSTEIIQNINTKKEQFEQFIRNRQDANQKLLVDQKLKQKGHPRVSKSTKKTQENLNQWTLNKSEKFTDITEFSKLKRIQPNKHPKINSNDPKVNENVIKSIFPELEIFEECSLLLPYFKKSGYGRLNIVSKQCVVLLILNTKLKDIIRRFLTRANAKKSASKCIGCNLHAVKDNSCEFGSKFRRKYKSYCVLADSLNVDLFTSLFEVFPEMFADKQIEFIWLFLINHKCGDYFYNFFLRLLHRLFQDQAVMSQIKKYRKLAKRQKNRKTKLKSIETQIKQIISANKRISPNAKKQFKRTLKLIYWTMCSILKHYFQQTILRNPSRHIYLDTFFNLRTEGTKFILIDCREPGEFAQGHIKQAIGISELDMIEQLFFNSKIQNYEMFFSILDSYKNCQIDARSLAEILQEYCNQINGSMQNQLDSDDLEQSKSKADTRNHLDISKFSFSQRNDQTTEKAEITSGSTCQYKSHMKSFSANISELNLVLPRNNLLKEDKRNDFPQKLRKNTILINSEKNNNSIEQPTNGELYQHNHKMNTQYAPVRLGKSIQNSSLDSQFHQFVGTIIQKSN